MCLIAFAWLAHEDFPLIVAGNRDEFYARPTAPADWWDDRQRLAGRDLKAGGTWMGVSRRGRFAALTNYRDPASFRGDAPSRGELVGDFLTSPSPAVDALNAVAADAARFNGFNLLAGEWQPDADAAGLWVVESPGSSDVRPVEPGVHGLSNARLDTAWPKVDTAVAGLRVAIAAGGGAEPLIERLFSVLADREIAPDDRLPHTGIAIETERALSAAFIRMPGYGTRASTILLMDREGHVHFVERACEPDRPADERRFAFAIDPAAVDDRS